MDPRLERQLQSMDHPFFKERPKGGDPFFAKRLKAMDPFYENLQKQMEVEVKEMSRSSTLNDSPRNPSRTSTFDVDSSDLSRASTLKAESPEIIKKAHRGRRSWTWAVVSQIISLLWLAPIITLLVLNYGKYVIGASIWCPGGDCSAEPFGPRAAEKRANLDNQDHDVMGVLQLVSKALEVWFMFISTSLVYDVAMLLAKKGGGLPVGFLLTHLEFGDVRYLLNPLLWTAAIPHPSGSPRLRAITGKLYLFVVLAASLTILTNLMGPATAVLILPTLQWIETPRVPDLVFNGTNAGFAPWGEDTIPGCSGIYLNNGQYSCTKKVYGPSLDGYAENMDASRMQFTLDYGDFLYTTSQEGSVQFAINISESNDVVWSPNRQALRDLSIDALNLDADVFGNGSEAAARTSNINFNNSLATVIQRQSISFGISAECFYGNVTVKQVDDERNVTCFENWQALGTNSNYTICIQAGPWDELTYKNSFFIGHSSTSKNKSDPMIQVNTFFSDKVTFFNESTDFETGISSCLKANVKCDWERIFAAKLPHFFWNQTSNAQIVEYIVPKRSWPDERAWCYWYTYLGFPTYSYDTSQYSNPLALVQLNNLTEIGPSDTPIVIHPDWMLAALSVEDGGTVDGDRSIAKAFVKNLPTTSKAWNDPSMVEFMYLYTYCVCQATSMIDWAFGDPTNSTIMATSSGPTFYRYVTLHQWSYGLSDQTSRFGVAVVLLGVACVFVRLVLALTFRFRHQHSAVELFVAALEHKSQGEFEGLDDELELARVRFEMMEDANGKPRFVAERRGTGFSDTSKDGFLAGLKNS